MCPSANTYVEISKESAQENYDKDSDSAKRMINSKWLKAPRPGVTRWPKNPPHSDFIEEVNDLITLLSRVHALPTLFYFEDWMYVYIKIILKGKQQVFWGEKISNFLHEQLNQVHTTHKFYMTSYLVYVATSMRNFLGLTIEGDRKITQV